MKDNISRAEAIQTLECFKMQLGDIVLRWVVDRVISIIQQLPNAEQEEDIL